VLDWTGSLPVSFSVQIIYCIVSYHCRVHCVWNESMAQSLQPLTVYDRYKCKSIWERITYGDSSPFTERRQIFVVRYIWLYSDGWEVAIQLELDCECNTLDAVVLLICIMCRLLQQCRWRHHYSVVYLSSGRSSLSSIRTRYRAWSVAACARTLNVHRVPDN